MGEHNQKQQTNELSTALASATFKQQAPILEAPRVRAVAHLKEKTVIKGYTSMSSGTEKVTGDVVWNAAGTFPLGIRVSLSPEGEALHAKTAYHFVPESACKLIEVLR